MSILKHISLEPLSGERKAKVKSYREVTNDQGGYLEIVLNLGDREFKYNLFPGTGATEGAQINYFSGALRKQLGIEGSVTVEEILEVAKEKEFKVWFSYSNEYNRLNVAFHQAATHEAADLTKVEA